MNDNIVVMRGITKRFPGVIANDHVDFILKKGEIHALLGENGAGKTTLMNILCGMYQQDKGTIIIDGKEVEIYSPQDAMAHGIFMIPQTPKLVESFTVLENLALSSNNFGIRINWKALRQRVEDLMKKYGIFVELDKKVWDLSLSEKKKVDILRALLGKARVLVFDEPTSMLSPAEVDSLFRFMREFRDSGGSVVFITHKLREAIGISDTITVMRKGKVVGTFKASEVNEEILAKLMFGEKPIKISYEETVVEREKRELLVIEDLSLIRKEKGKYLENINLVLRQYEIVGVAGVAGNGQRELVEAIIGIEKPSQGKILFRANGKLVDITKLGLKALAKEILGYVPDDKMRLGVVPLMNIAENLVLKDYDKPEISGKLALNYEKLVRRAWQIIREYNIKASSPEILVKYLSGGNVQRLIIARELKRDPKLIIAQYPTLGLDARLTSIVRGLLLELKKRGAAILLISEDLEELLQLSDRIIVMYKGRIVGEFNRDEFDPEKISRLMVGLQ